MLRGSILLTHLFNSSTDGQLPLAIARLMRPRDNTVAP